MRTKTVKVNDENSSLDMIKRMIWINVIFYPDELVEFKISPAEFFISIMSEYL